MFAGQVEKASGFRKFSDSVFYACQEFTYKHLRLTIKIVQERP
jgi:hypothetical protein